MVAKVDSGCLVGLQAARVPVEISLAKGLPRFSIVGLPDASVREARDRVVSAIRNTGFEFPSRRVTVNLAPAELKKEGPVFDLAIAIGILMASDAVSPPVWPRAIWLGELALDGSVRPIRGALPLVRGLAEKGWTQFVLPEANLSEVSFINGIRVLPSVSLRQTVRSLELGEAFPPVKRPAWQAAASSASVNFSEIKGQALAKRALEIAAAGRHNVLFIGCPGTGKSMLAQALPGIMPRWNLDEALDATQVHSAAGVGEKSELLSSRPFRTPHHSISPAALIGGGDIPQPGEISLAHRGVLFLDELAEFRRDALEALRQPLEEGIIQIHRMRGRASFPADFVLVGAMNPCPCGNRGHPKKECICSDLRVQNYRGKVSGPLIDRIDLHVELPVPDVQDLLNEHSGAESSDQILPRIDRAWARQRRRVDEGYVRRLGNARLRPGELPRICPLDGETTAFLKNAIDRLGLSARAFDKVRRVARTVADLEGVDQIAAKHVAEAIHYRAFDRSAQS